MIKLRIFIVCLVVSLPITGFGQNKTKSIYPYLEAPIYTNGMFGIGSGLVFNHKSGNVGLRIGPTYNTNYTGNKWLLGSQAVVHLLDSLKNSNMYLYREMGFQYNGFVKSSSQEIRTLNYMLGSGITYELNKHRQTLVFNAIIRLPLDEQTSLDKILIGSVKLLVTLN